MPGLRLVHGRAPTQNVVGVAFINQTGARAYFGRESVVGETVPIADRRGASSEIVGVLQDLSLDHPSAQVEPVLLHTALEGGTSIVIRSEAPLACKPSCRAYSIRVRSISTPSR